MLEAGEVLRCWALAEPPEPGKTVAGEQLADHRRAYLDYEGPVPRARGSVSRWDAGSYQTVEETDDRLVVDLAGERLRGRVSLVRSNAESQQWEVSF